MQKIRVLFFLNSFRVGGSERQAMELLKRIDRKRFDPLVACFQKDGPLLDELPADIRTIEVFPINGFFNARIVRYAIRYLVFLSRMRPQIVQCFDFYSNVFAIPLSWLARTAVIVGSRRDEGLSMRNMTQHRVELCCLRLATGIVANSDAIKHQLINRDRLATRPIWTIHNGLDLDRFGKEHMLAGNLKVRKPHQTTIAVIANLRPEKNHLMMLESFRLLLNRISTVDLLLVGDGPMRPSIVERIKELGLSDHVHLTGMIKNIPSVLKNVDIVASASMSEAFPNSILEAMAGGLPVVATDVGGTRDLVVDGTTGYLVAPNDPIELARKLELLCQSRETRLSFGKAAKQIISERYTVDHMTTAFETLYARLMAV